jgi:hypothetical protein
MTISNAVCILYSVYHNDLLIFLILQTYFLMLKLYCYHLLLLLYSYNCVIVVDARILDPIGLIIWNVIY